MRNCTENCKENDGNCPIPGSDGLPLQCVGEWVKDKYYYLERYLNASKNARKKFTDKGNSVYIDLFSGPGRCIIRYQDKEIENGGTRVLKRDIPFNEHFFIDINDANITALKTRVGNNNSCIYRCGDSNVVIKDLVGTFLKKNFRYHFAYIDPFGPDGLKFSTIEYLSKLQRIDLFIHFPIGAIRRNLAKWQEYEYTILDEFLGTTEWRKNVSDLRSGKMLEGLLQVFKDQLLKVGFPEKGLKVDTSMFNSLPVVSVKNTINVELYVLILASKDPTIVQEIWNSVISISPEGQRQFGY